jgi:hypothetical protein
MWMVVVKYPKVGCRRLWGNARRDVKCRSTQGDEMIQSWRWNGDAQGLRDKRDRWPTRYVDGLLQDARLPGFQVCRVRKGM